MARSGATEITNRFWTVTRCMTASSDLLLLCLLSFVLGALFVRAQKMSGVIDLDGGLFPIPVYDRFVHVLAIFALSHDPQDLVLASLCLNGVLNRVRERLQLNNHLFCLNGDTECQPGTDQRCYQ